MAADKVIIEKYSNLARLSIEEQRRIEDNDTLTLDEYLADYYDQ